MSHMLPPLPYHHASLVPHIDARTMMLHHDKHHASYVANLNSVLEAFPVLHERTALWLLLNLGEVPQNIRTVVRNNAGGHVNHSLLWRSMSPAASGGPSGLLLDAINRDFGGLEHFKAQFAKAGSRLFGSGWVWLVRAQHAAGRLQIYTTTGHDNPLMQGFYPILVNDVWEHAYYLGHENRREDYLQGWWPVVNWEEASRRFDRSSRGDKLVWEGDGGSLPAAMT
jgi:Fe-Mn family superoxide dismutase